MSGPPRVTSQGAEQPGHAAAGPGSSSGALSVADVALTNGVAPPLAEGANGGGLTVESTAAAVPGMPQGHDFSQSFYDYHAAAASLLSSGAAAAAAAAAAAPPVGASMVGPAVAAFATLGGAGAGSTPMSTSAAASPPAQPGSAPSVGGSTTAARDSDTVVSVSSGTPVVKKAPTNGTGNGRTHTDHGGRSRNRRSSRQAVSPDPHRRQRDVLRWAMKNIDEARSRLVKETQWVPEVDLGTSKRRRRRHPLTIAFNLIERSMTQLTDVYTSLEQDGAEKSRDSLPAAVFDPTSLIKGRGERSSRKSSISSSSASTSIPGSTQETGGRSQAAPVVEAGFVGAQGSATSLTRDGDAVKAGSPSQQGPHGAVKTPWTCFCGFENRFTVDACASCTAPNPAAVPGNGQTDNATKAARVELAVDRGRDAGLREDDADTPNGGSVVPAVVVPMTGPSLDAAAAEAAPPVSVGLATLVPSPPPSAAVAVAAAIAANHQNADAKRRRIETR